MSKKLGNHGAAAVKPENISPARDPYRWVVFGIISSIYFFVYFHRVSTSVIAPDLLSTFQTDATALGFMSSMYFYVYAFEQPLVGYLADRLGPRRVISLWTLTAALGCLIFGFAPTIGWAAVGRAIIGFGVGGVYVPALKAFSQWFEKNEFATMVGLFLAAGNLGALVATTPLVWTAQAFGWRSSFFVIAGITLILALAAFFLTHDHTRVQSPVDPSGTSENPSPRKASPSIMSVLISFRFWVYGSLLFGVAGPFLTLQGLWATPYLMSRFGVELTYASNINMLIPLGFIAGSPLWGWLGSRVFRNKFTLLICLLAITTTMWTGLIVNRIPLGITGIMIVFFVVGCASGGLFTIIWTLVRESTPGSVLGLTTGLMNPLPMLGIAVFQIWTGTIIDRVGQVNGIYPPEAFRNAFSLCFAVTVGCLVIALLARKKLFRDN
ncbi:MAG: MFS transporter [Deltaproteobacteria bacterium]|nr:MFS transporter [Deltaproteobacteria bacterium]